MARAQNWLWWGLGIALLAGSAYIVYAARSDDDSSSAPAGGASATPRSAPPPPSAAQPVGSSASSSYQAAPPKAGPELPPPSEPNAPPASLPEAGGGDGAPDATDSQRAARNLRASASFGEARGGVRTGRRISDGQLASKQVCRRRFYPGMLVLIWCRIRLWYKHMVVPRRVLVFGLAAVLQVRCRGP